MTIEQKKNEKTKYNIIGLNDSKGIYYSLVNKDVWDDFNSYYAEYRGYGGSQGIGKNLKNDYQNFIKTYGKEGCLINYELDSDSLADIIRFIRLNNINLIDSCEVFE